MDVATAEKIVIQILKKRADVPGALGDVLDQIVGPALQDAVRATATPLDDIAVAALEPILADYLKKQISAFWAQLLSPAPAAPSAPSHSQPPGNPV